MSEHLPQLATERAALFMQLVPYLINKGEVTLADAAADFDVTPEYMRSMVEKLTVMGLPGERGFWGMANELFDINWDLLEQQDRIVITNTVGLEHAPKLTSGEAAALLVGLQLAQTIPGLGNDEISSGLLAKLSRGASAAPDELIVIPGPVTSVQATVAHAISHAVAVSFTYLAPNATPTVRTVDPIKVHIAGGQWYLQGWCHLRNAMRTFHLDRVSDLALSDTPSVHVGEDAPAWASGTDDLLVCVRFPEAVTPLLGAYLDRATVDTVDGVSTAWMPVADEYSLRRLVARRGGEVEVIAPAPARRAAYAWAHAGIEQYADTSGH